MRLPVALCLPHSCQWFLSFLWTKRCLLMNYRFSCLPGNHAGDIIVRPFRLISSLLVLFLNFVANIIRKHQGPKDPCETVTFFVPLNRYTYIVLFRCDVTIGRMYNFTASVPHVADCFSLLTYWPLSVRTECSSCHRLMSVITPSPFPLTLLTSFGRTPIRPSETTEKLSFAISFKFRAPDNISVKSQFICKLQVCIE